MSNFGDWFQNNWYQLGSFLVQVGFFFAAIWFADRVLKTLRASQEQVGALLKLSVSGVSISRPQEAAAPSRVADSSPYWLESALAHHTQRFGTSRDDFHHGVASGPGLVGWLKTPMGITNGTSSFHRVLRWFQSPANT